MDNETSIKIIDGAIDLLETKDWCRGDYAIDGDGRVVGTESAAGPYAKYCVVGALCASGVQVLGEIEPTEDHLEYGWDPNNFDDTFERINDSKFTAALESATKAFSVKLSPPEWFDDYSDPNEVWDVVEFNDHWARSVDDVVTVLRDTRKILVESDKPGPPGAPH